MPDQEFTQNIRVDGAEEAKRKLDEVGEATGQVSEKTEEAGNVSQQAGDKIQAMSNVTENAAKSVRSYIAGYAGINTIIAGVRELLSYLQDVEEIQRRLAGNTVQMSGATKTLRRQLGVSEEEGIGILTDFRATSGMNALEASEFIKSADIAFGGKLLQGENLATAKDIASWAGGVGATASESSDLMRFLAKTGQLGSPEQAKLALSKIQAAAKAADVNSPGLFAAQLLKGGMGMAQAGLSLDDILNIGGLTRNVETSGDLAAESMKQLQRVATGAEDQFTAEMIKIASGRGQTVSTMGTDEKINLARDILGGVDNQAEENRVRGMFGSVEMAERLLKAFRASNVIASQKVAQDVSTASVDAYAALVQRYWGEAGYKSDASDAVIEGENALAGFEQTALALERRKAEAAHQRQIASGKSTFWDELIGLDEQFEEGLIGESLKTRIEQLRQDGGVSASEEDRIKDIFKTSEQIRMQVGWRDDLLRELISLVDKMEQREYGNRPINVTVVQHQQVDGGNGYESTYVDLPGD